MRGGLPAPVPLLSSFFCLLSSVFCLLSSGFFGFFKTHWVFWVLFGFRWPAAFAPVLPVGLLSLGILAERIVHIDLEHIKGHALNGGHVEQRGILTVKIPHHICEDHASALHVELFNIKLPAVTSPEFEPLWASFGILCHSDTPPFVGLAKRREV